MQSQTISVRKPALDFTSNIERFYFDGDPVKTYIFNALNLLFPEGERYFVKSVHRYSKDITDPVLLREMREFAGQEGQHAHQHERFFVVMKEQGYRTERFLELFGKSCRGSSKRVPRWLNLAITAGSEHYTAIMAAAVLESGLLEDCHPTMRDLITWHAVEEIEHKHVAYDVFIKMHPYNYLLRILGFIVSTMSISVHAAFCFLMLLRQDRVAGRVTSEQLNEGRRKLFRGRELRFLKLVLRSIIKYYAPGFHPSQQDDSALLKRYAPQIPQVSSAA